LRRARSEKAEEEKYAAAPVAKSGALWATLEKLGAHDRLEIAPDAAAEANAKRRSILQSQEGGE
jgi:hypothetical protein